MKRSDILSAGENVGNRVCTQSGIAPGEQRDRSQQADDGWPLSCWVSRARRECPASARQRFFQRQQRSAKRGIAQTVVVFSEPEQQILNGPFR